MAKKSKHLFYLWIYRITVPAEGLWGLRCVCLCASGSQVAVGESRLGLAGSTGSAPPVFHPPGIHPAWACSSRGCGRVTRLRKSNDPKILLAYNLWASYLSKASHMFEHKLKDRGVTLLTVREDCKGLWERSRIKKSEQRSGDFIVPTAALEASHLTASRFWEIYVLP